MSNCCITFVYGKAYTGMKASLLFTLFLSSSKGLVCSL